MLEVLLTLNDFAILKTQSTILFTNLTKKEDSLLKDNVINPTQYPGYLYFQFSYGQLLSANITYAIGVRSGVCVIDENLSYTLHLAYSNSTGSPIMDSLVIATYYSDSTCNEVLQSSVLTDFQKSGPFGSEGKSSDQLDVRGLVSLGEELRLDFKAVVLGYV